MFGIGRMIQRLLLPKRRPGMTSKQKISYCLQEMRMAETEKPKVIRALQANGWKISAALGELRQQGRY
jgi:hypothetical protein